MSVPRPALRYHGGKWRIAPWVMSHFPPHRIYVEPFGGAGSVLLRKPRAFADVYNDLDGDMVNLFRVLRDPGQATQLRLQLELTPFSRTEFWATYEELDPGADPVERARRTVVRAFMAFGTSSQKANRSGFRATAYRQNATGPNDWRTYPSGIPAIVERLQGVCIENRPALEVIAQQDRPETLFYCDPPYPFSTRTSLGGRNGRERGYRCEMTDDDHRALAAALHGIAGMAVISGYACPLYDQELYPDWRRFSTTAQADGGKQRTEVLWMNPAALAAYRYDLEGIRHGQP